MTPEQQKAIVLAKARQRAAEADRSRQPGHHEAVGDVMRSGSSGLAQGFTGLLDFPARIPGMVAQSGSFLAEKAGLVEPEAAQRFRSDISELGSHGGATRLATDIAPEVMNYQPETTAGEFAQTTGEFLPGIALGGTTTQMVAAGLGSEAGGQLTEGTPAEPWARVGGALAGGLAATPRPSAASMTGDRAAAANRLRTKGITPTAGQVKDSSGVMRAEGTLAPTGKQLNQFTRASLKETGYIGPSQRATAPVLKSQRDKITRDMNGILDVDVPIASHLGDDALAVVNDFLEATPNQNLPMRLRNVASELIEAATDPSGKSINGGTLRKWRTALGRYTTSNDEAIRDASHELREVIDSATESTLLALGKTDDVARLEKLRTQYRNLLVVADATTRGGRGGASGVLTPERVSTSAKRILGRSRFAMGEGTDLAELSNDALMIIGSMPTVSAGGVRDVINAGVTGMGGAIIGAQGGSVKTALAGAAAGALAPAITRAGMRSGVVQSSLMQPQNLLRGIPSSLPALLNGQ